MIVNDCGKLNSYEKGIKMRNIEKPKFHSTVTISNDKLPFNSIHLHSPIKNTQPKSDKTVSSSQCIFTSPGSKDVLHTYISVTMSEKYSTFKI